jgi:hypothetical protein
MEPSTGTDSVRPPAAPRPLLGQLERYPVGVLGDLGSDVVQDPGAEPA